MQPKYQQVLDALERRIVSGELKAGDRLPSEAELVKAFQTSRITVGRAVRELQQRGLVARRAGSGTFVRRPGPERKEMTFGLLIPDLGQTEIFDPICRGMTRAPDARRHALIWGNVGEGNESKEEQAWQLCTQYIDRGVSGVFFAPLELVPGMDEVNQRIAAALERARIPIVLLDRGIYPYPRQSGHDLVGIDNRRAGYTVAEHLLRLGCRRVAFVALPGSAPTVDAREAGYREALRSRRAAGDGVAQRLDPSDDAVVREMMRNFRPDGIVCANDQTAARLMHTLLRLGWKIPSDVRLVGIDDVEYARFLPVPLTTLRQPCREIGEVAMTAMLDRIARPGLPAREILLDCTLVVRQSCGSESGP
jgi:DNA-binding LacI/PurR family transcriptional regulator